jgi:hypothetical protein
MRVLLLLACVCVKRLQNVWFLEIEDPFLKSDLKFGALDFRLEPS